MEIKIRNPKPEDLNFIFSTWKKSFLFSSAFTQDIDNNLFYAVHQEGIESAIDRGAQLFLAVNPEDPDQIYGWSCQELIFDTPTVALLSKAFPEESNLVSIPAVHFVYVKPIFRKFGISKKLLPNPNEPALVSHLTFVGKKLLPKKWRYCPYVF